jgi:hypothetical protein
MMRWFLFLLASALYAIAASDMKVAPLFKENASEFVEVGFSEGRTGKRVTELSVSVKISDIFENNDAVDVDDLNLEIKTDNECWTRVGGTPVRRGRERRMWRLKVVPCKSHSIRIGLRRAGCVEYLEYPGTIGPATATEIANSHYRPKIPGNIVITPISNESVTVSWHESECSESYDLWYESDSGLDLGNMTIPAGVGSVTIAGLETCTEYTAYIVATRGDEFSDEGRADFTTCFTNTTDILDTIGTEVKNNYFCKQVDDECEFAVKIEELENEELFMIKEEEVASLVNETQSNAQIGHSSISTCLRTNILSLSIISFVLLL